MYVVYKGKYWSGNIDLKIFKEKVRATSVGKIKLQSSPINH